MGLLLSLPLAGVFGTVGSSCLAGLAFCFTSTAASMFFKSCNCNSSIATRVGFAMIFVLNSLLAWFMKTPLAIGLLQKWSPEYTKLDCPNGSCYGVLAVHRVCFSLVLLHTFLSALLIGVKDTRNKRSAIQNGWWGPKVLAWFILLGVSFFIPNGFFIFWGNYISVIGATIFILIGLVLLVDFAHSWSETCTENWEMSDSSLWKWILIGSTGGMYAAVITLTGVMYGFFAGAHCSLNQFFISFNLALCFLITILCVHPAVQEANPRSGLAQSSMVAAYCTYLIMSAVANHVDGKCNPLHKDTPGSVDATKNTTVVLGAVFTFLAIAYSTSRAATQSRALVGKRRKDGGISLPVDHDHDGHSTHGLVTTQPSRTETPRYQALLAAVEAGAIPASALDEELSDDEDDDGPTGEERDDERTGTRYNYSWFHIIFVMGAMYVAMLLTDWNVLRTPRTEHPDQDIYIGRSETAMWIRVVSSWICILLYSWSLLAPVVMPDRFGDF
ncbi:TMS membrane protein/tumor differentially expressed protein [Exidia glandulosa HHB12029]|uniref:TMS membrane protein/tumor differentially expressed protein n=1 Tax=Exidia glandulosa HHB12029 TaxID=1314781 RepID=A0A166AAY4_EXIGL|nr:TMS membrane protein/tumor differentially expressed protein [Exidia glandulosa HHB12029]